MKRIDPNSMAVISLPATAIRPFKTNPREHPKRQLEMLRASIEKFGFNNPILVATPVDGMHDIIAGHGRLIAARDLGYADIPAIILPHLSEAEQRAYRIADNAIALKGSWSPELLALEAKFVFDADIALDPEDIGFETAEIDMLLLGSAKAASEDEDIPDEITEPDRRVRPVSRLGDLWTIGRHSVMCGDARDPGVIAKLMGTDHADVVSSDMPFNLKVNGHIGGKGKIKHPEFAMASGEMSRDEFRAFMTKVMDNQAQFSKPGALSYQFIDWRSIDLMVEVGKTIYDALLAICVWVKPQPAMGSLYRSRHEFVCVFRNKGGGHVNNVQLGKFGRNRSNVWEYASPGGFGPEREKLAFHPTVKNVEMIADLILDSTPRKGIVLDVFLGSGTTILAAEKTGRTGRGVEVDPGYVDIALKRIAEAVGEEPVLHDGRRLSVVRDDRAEQED